MTAEDWSERGSAVQLIAVPGDAPSEVPRDVPPTTIAGALELLLSERRPPKLVFQPIVDLQRAVVAGYEVLSRFPGPPAATPDKWFLAAHAIGRANELEALVIEQALACREQLPTNCFLSLNLSPEALLDARVRRVLSARPLSRVVLELTEHAQVTDYDMVASAIAEARALGAFVAVDDAGAGYASLQHILALRPDFVKLDRALIAGLQHDEAKAALVEMFGGFTSRLDAWLLAEGIEEHAELARLVQLGVPLGQGYFLGRPAPSMGPLGGEVSGLLRPSTPPPEGDVVMLALAEPHDAVDANASDESLAARWARTPDLGCLPLLDESSRPVALAMYLMGQLSRRPVTAVLESVSVREALERALTRPNGSRFDPLVCCNEQGHYLGLVRIERMVEVLLREAR